MTTSGSSGPQGRLRLRPPGLGERRSRMFLRTATWVGLGRACRALRLAPIGGAASTHMSRAAPSPLDVGLHRCSPLSVTTPLAELVPRLNDFQPRLPEHVPLDGRPAGRRAARRPPAPAPRDVTTNSEPLTPELRERLERAFGVRPANFYATTEGLWGNECERGAACTCSTTCASSRTWTPDGRRVPRRRAGGAPARHEPVQPHSAADPLRGRRPRRPRPPAVRRAGGRCCGWRSSRAARGRARCLASGALRAPAPVRAA